MKTSEMSSRKERDLPSIEDVKAHTSMVVLVGRNVALKKRGHEHFGLCPFHNEKSPSFKVNEAKRTFHCFGCGVHGDAFDYLLRTQGMELHEALEHLAIEAGMIADREGRRHPTRQPTAPPIAHGEPPRQDNPNGPLALEIWRATRPTEGSPAEDYLRGRGIIGPIPPTIRYHPALLHADTGIHLPALVAAVCSVERKVTGVQRIFLTMDGRKAPLTRPKMALGTLRGGAVRLAPTTDRAWLTEGIEDGLAVMQMMGEPAWAVLGTSGYKTVELPENVRQVILAPDGDDAGQATIQEAARRLAGQGREVRAAKLPPGKDWCDVLDTYEERAGILEFDLEEFRPETEALARSEAIHG